MPYSCMLIGVELTNKATPIIDYAHTLRAIYLLGAEDNGLSKQSLSKCQQLISLPGDISLNVAVAGSIVMFDRQQKMND